MKNDNIKETLKKLIEQLNTNIEIANYHHKEFKIQEIKILELKQSISILESQVGDLTHEETKQKEINSSDPSNPQLTID